MFAHQTFRLVLGLEVRIFQAFGLIEHVFTEHAGIQTGSGDGTGVMETAGLDDRRQLQGVLGTADVGQLLAVGIRRQVVDCGQMEEMLDLAFKRGNLGSAQAQLGFGKIAGDRNDAFHVPSHRLANLAEFLG